MDQYLLQREQFVQQVTSQKYAGISFTPIEEQANALYRQVLVRERALLNDQFYRSYTLKHRKDFEKNSRIYEAVARLPKGAVLHIHIDCCIDIDWFMEELVEHENTYFNPVTNTFVYSKHDKVQEGFLNLKNLKHQSQDKAKFEEQIRSVLFVQESERMDSTVNVWRKFESKIMSAGGLIYFKHHFKAYLRRFLQNFINQGVTHIEARSFLGSMFHEDGTNLSFAEEAEIIESVISDIKQTHPQFSFQIIIQGLKMWDLNTIENYLKQALLAKKQFPHLIVAFDLVQEEDAWKSTLQFAPVLIKLKQLEQEVGVELPFVFHGGESLQSITNTNLFDLLLLGTKRIGHGINLAQHSYLFDKIKSENICLEICPVSNQLLNYIDDIRLHPIKTFLNYGIKVSINPDDPGFFGYDGVNMDFFFVSIGTELDYKDLKKCVHNSIECSFMSNEQKKVAWESHELQFQEWAKWFIERNQSSPSS